MPQIGTVIRRTKNFYYVDIGESEPRLCHIRANLFHGKPKTNLVAVGDQVEIEHRPQEESTHFQGVATAPEDIPAFNPSFDVTPHNYICDIITETCVCTALYSATLTEAVQQVEQEL